MSKAKKILYVSPSSVRAGAEQVTKSIILGHDSNKWISEMVFLKEGPFVDEMRALGVVCHVCKNGTTLRMRNPASVIRLGLEISKIAKIQKADLIHSVMGYGHVVGGMAAIWAGLPEVWFQHGPTGPLDYLTGLVPSQAIFVNSNYTLNRQKMYFATTRSLHTVYPGVEKLRNLDFRQDEAKIFRTKAWNQDSDKIFVFGLMGRIAKMKGQLLFVEAAIRLIKEIPEVRFLLIGSGFDSKEDLYVQDVIQKIKNSGFENHFHITGFLSDPKVALASLDVLVNCSVLPEPFGMTLIESMQLGIPVIAPNEAGPAEILSDSLTKYLFEARSIDSLCEKMQMLYQMKRNSNSFLELNKQLKEVVKNHFSSDQMTKKIEGVYENVLKTP